jgi:hypothetical protein
VIAMRALGAALVLLGSACAAPLLSARCPSHTAPLPERLARIHRLLDGDAEAAALLRGELLQVCFGNGTGAGVLSGELALLDSQDNDAQIAARLAHLLIHHRDGLRTGCAEGRAGLEAAMRSEERAAALELRLRRRFGLSTAAMAADARADYLRRCAERERPEKTPSSP